MRKPTINISMSNSTAGLVSTSGAVLAPRDNGFGFFGTVHTGRSSHAETSIGANSATPLEQVLSPRAKLAVKLSSALFCWLIVAALVELGIKTLG